MKQREDLIKLGLSEKKADEVMLLESKMLEQAVKFQFRKKDGTIRDAEGTLDRSKMVMENGKLWEPKGAPKPEVVESLRYWDLGKRMWREMKVLNLIAVGL